MTDSTVATIERKDVKTLAIEKFHECGTVTHACAAVGIARRTWYDWIESDPDFAAAVVSANEAVTDDLEKEAIQRAKDGSDTLIIFLLKARRAEKYRETQRIEVVSPEVRDNLRATIRVITEELDNETAKRVIARLDTIWQ